MTGPGRIVGSRSTNPAAKMNIKALKPFKPVVRDDLRFYPSKKVDAYISNGVFSDFFKKDIVFDSSSKSDVIERSISDIYSVIQEYDPIFIEYINSFKDVHPKHKIAILSAHGTENEFGQWMYEGNRRSHPIESWIKKHEKNYSVFLVHLCNTYHYSLKGKFRSLVVIPDNMVSEGFASHSLISWTMHYINFEIYSQTVEWELNFLKDLKPFKSADEMIKCFLLKNI